MASDPTSMPKLLLTPREAARALAISERTLWSLTQRGEVPAVRLGRSVRYSPESLQRWIASKQNGHKNGDGADGRGDGGAAP